MISVLIQKACWGKFSRYTLCINAMSGFSAMKHNISLQITRYRFAVWHVSVLVNHCCVFFRAEKVWPGFVSSVTHGNVMKYWFVLNKNTSHGYCTQIPRRKVFGWNWGIELRRSHNVFCAVNYHSMFNLINQIIIFTQHIFHQLFTCK